MPEELPDLDTDEIGWIAYWNALEAGAEVIDVTEVAESMSGLYNFSISDNGFDARLDHDQDRAGGLPINVRVKSDGYFIAWTDNNESFGLTTDSEILRGLHDVLGDWSDYGSGSVVRSLSDNVLFRTIEDMAEASDMEGASFDKGEAGLYNYLYENATEAILLSVDTDGTHEFMFVDEVDVVAHHVSLSGIGSSISGLTMEFEGDALHVYERGNVATSLSEIENPTYEPETPLVTEFSGSNTTNFQVYHLILIE